MTLPLFHDRTQAGRKLAMALGRHRSNNPLILALPRGGVPVAYEVARALEAEMDLLLVRKIGAPGQKELAIGAVVDGANPQLVLNEDAVRSLAPSPNYIRSEMQRQLQELERRRRTYLGTRAPIPVGGRDVIVVDDGVATGSTMLAALQGVRKNDPRSLTLAVPVAPSSAVEILTPQCDEVVCLATPEPFAAVGLHYADFNQTTDEEVIMLLRHADAAARERHLARRTG